MIFIIGDSHANAIKSAAIADGFPISGGFLDGGRNVNVDFYQRVGDDFKFKDARVDHVYRSYLTEGGYSNFVQIDCPILCLLGMNIHYLSRAELWESFSVDEDGTGQFLSSAVIRNMLRGMIAGALSFYRDAMEMGHTVYSALPPRRTPTRDTKSLPPIFNLLETVLLEELTEMGVTVVDHRSWSLGADGNLKQEYAFPDDADDVHGSEQFGRELLHQLRGYLETIT